MSCLGHTGSERFHARVENCCSCIQSTWPWKGKLEYWEHSLMVEYLPDFTGPWIQPPALSKRRKDSEYEQGKSQSQAMCKLLLEFVPSMLLLSLLLPL